MLAFCVAGPMWMAIRWPGLAPWREPRALLFAILAVGLVFLPWDVHATRKGHWSFSDQHTLGARILWLPIEEWLFFPAMTFTSIVLWNWLRDSALRSMREQPLTVMQGVPGWATLLPGAGVSAIVLLIHAEGGRGSYTGLVLIAALWTLPLVAGLLPRLFATPSFWRLQGLMLIGLVVVNGWLTSRPIVSYNNDDNLGVRLGTIPVEDFLYGMLIATLAVSAWEFTRARAARFDVGGPEA